MKRDSQEIWDKAKLLRYNGFQWKQISAETGISVSRLQRRATKEDWGLVIQSTRQMVAERPNTDENTGEQVRALLQRDCLKTVSELPRQSRSAKGFKARQEAIGAFIDNASKAFGWSDGKAQNTIVNVSVLTQANDREREKHAYSEDPIIDVESPDTPS